MKIFKFPPYLAINEAFAYLGVNDDADVADGKFDFGVASVGLAGTCGEDQGSGISLVSKLAKNVAPSLSVDPERSKLRLVVETLISSVVKLESLFSSMLSKLSRKGFRVSLDKLGIEGLLDLGARPRFKLPDKSKDTRLDLAAEENVVFCVLLANVFVVVLCRKILLVGDGLIM